MVYYPFKCLFTVEAMTELDDSFLTFENAVACLPSLSCLPKLVNSSKS